MSCCYAFYHLGLMYLFPAYIVLICGHQANGIWICIWDGEVRHTLKKKRKQVLQWYISLTTITVTCFACISFLENPALRKLQSRMPCCTIPGTPLVTVKYQERCANARRSKQMAGMVADQNASRNTCCLRESRCLTIGGLSCWRDEPCDAEAKH